MDLDSLDLAARCLLSTIAAEARTAGDWPRSRWTREVKERCEDLAIAWAQNNPDEWLGLLPCATGAVDRCGAYNADNEWVTDLVWFVYDPPASTRSQDALFVDMPLALESELSRNDRDDDDRDFLKLVASRARLRLMVQRHATATAAVARCTRYKKLVAASRGSQPGDHYLFAVLINWREFHFETYVHS